MLRKNQNVNDSWYFENNVDPNDSIGIDEVGRGPLAGPVVAVACWISRDGISLAARNDIVIRDSKKLSHIQRNRVIEWANSLRAQNILKYAVGEASVQEIDSLNILKAAMLAMQRAYEKLNLQKSFTLVDGNRAPDLKNTEVRTIVKGDNTVISIALASIIAKEYRDNIMRQLSLEYPQYSWDTNVGYGSKKHLEAISQYGATPHHRMTFAPLNKLI